VFCRLYVYWGGSIFGNPQRAQHYMTTPAKQTLVPPFTYETAVQKVRNAEDGWNSRNPEKVSLVYTVDSMWRNRAEFVVCREQIIQFLPRKWNRELDYRQIKEIFCFHDDRIFVRFAYKWHDDADNWFRSYGSENWEFDRAGLIHHRYACITDLLYRRVRTPVSLASRTTA
jgi:uncharacterized protein